MLASRLDNINPTAPLARSQQFKFSLSRSVLVGCKIVADFKFMTALLHNA